MQNILILLGLIVEICGVFMYSWGEIKSAAGKIRLHSTGAEQETPGSFRDELRKEPWWKKWPILLAARFGSEYGASYVYDEYVPKFWGLALLGFGFVMQALAVLLILLRY